MMKDCCRDQIIKHAKWFDRNYVMEYGKFYRTILEDKKLMCNHTEDSSVANLHGMICAAGYLHEYLDMHIRHLKSGKESCVEEA